MSRILKPHGTHAAYERHRLHNEEPCEACKTAHREHSRAVYKNLSKTQRAKIKVRARKRVQDFPGIDRNSVLLRRYGITHEEKRALYDLQKGRCAIGIRCAGKVIPFDEMQVDHDHVVNVPRNQTVRGLACRLCNTLLGMLGDTLKAVEVNMTALRRYLVETHAMTQRALKDAREIPINLSNYLNQL